jgi:hypothetical protein
MSERAAGGPLQLRAAGAAAARMLTQRAQPVSRAEADLFVYYHDRVLMCLAELLRGGAHISRERKPDVSVMEMAYDPVQGLLAVLETAACKQGHRSPDTAAPTQLLSLRGSSSGGWRDLHRILLLATNDWQFTSATAPESCNGDWSPMSRPSPQRWHSCSQTWREQSVATMRPAQDGLPIPGLCA